VINRHVFESIALTPGSRCTCGCFYGRDQHHITEAEYKAVARALRAGRGDRPPGDGVPSTKGTL